MAHINLNVVTVSTLRTRLVYLALTSIIYDIPIFIGITVLHILSR